MRRDAPPRATRCEVASEASCPARGVKFSTLPFGRLPSRSAVFVQARHRSRLIGKFNFQLSIFNLGGDAPLSLSHCKVTTRDGRNQAFGPNDAARPRVFLLRRRCSALIVSRLVANGQKGQRADGLWLMRGGGQVARRGWASGQSGHLVKIDFGQTETPL